MCDRTEGKVSIEVPSIVEEQAHTSCTDYYFSIHGLSWMASIMIHTYKSLLTIKRIPQYHNIIVVHIYLFEIFSVGPYGSYNDVSV